uniref:Reverse transcriptase domain-containing protein n=1 Tax=Cannabis sativa TaxID=3483 RepID=A0A803PTY7_CANSA
MAKTRSKHQGKSKNSSVKQKKKGPTSVSDVIRTKSMDVVLGINPLDLSDEDDEPDAIQSRSSPAVQDFQEPLSPRASLREIRRTEDARSDFLHFVQANNQCNSNARQGKLSIPPILRFGIVIRNLEQSFQQIEKPVKVKIELEDIEEEISYWNPSIVCYVLGSNPPLHILDGFANRIWKEKVDKVKLLTYGIFLIRFHSVEIRDEILNGGYIFFNKRPVIMKPWDPNTNFRREDVKQVPIWVQLEELELKYWSQKSLFKIVGQVGKPIMVDSVTKARERLNYPRVLIEVQMNQPLPDMLDFEDEFGMNVSVGINYEWKPIICSNCSGMGHSTANCRKNNKSKQEWIIKEDKRPQKPTAIIDAEGFQTVQKGKKSQVQGQSSVTTIGNGFQVLSECVDMETLAGVAKLNVENSDYDIANTREGGALSWSQNGGFVGLLETRVKVHKLGALYLNVFNGWCFSSNIAWHRGGKIVIAWDLMKFNVDILKCTSQLMHLKLATVHGNFCCFLTVVYGANEREGRKTLWEDLCKLDTNDKWLRWEILMQFWPKKNELGIRATGCYYTWSNKQQRHNRIYSKIDRVLANQEWIDCYPNAEAIFVNEGAFDHSPSMLSLYPNWRSGKKPFKYFRMWSSHPMYSTKVKEEWNKETRGTKMYQLICKLKALKPVFKEINKEGFSDIQAAYSQAKNELDLLHDQLQLDPLNSTLHTAELEARDKLAATFKNYNSFLQQKVKANWIQNGDCNTSVFHASLRQRYRQNQVLSIVREDGVRVSEPNQVTEAFIDYYKTLLGSKMVNRKKVSKKVIAEGPVLDSSQGAMLMEKFTKEEVKKALFGIPGNKAPGPDGYSSFFFQDNWDLVGEDLYQAVTSFLESGSILKEINTTILTMVPKTKCPTTVKDFRPIACCNVIYKVATKLLCSRIKCILPNLVAQNQGGFIQGRFIGHNIMICQDLVRHYGRKSGKPNCLIKLDLQKAYDTVEWDFVEEMLLALQFPQAFVRLVMNCVRTHRFSIMFNGSTHGFFGTSRGLRQGDPMSPLLFVIGMEYLSRVLKVVGKKENFSFHERCSDIKLNHLAFADDVLLFCKGEFRSIYYILQGLKLFSQTSGLHPNPQKSAIYCSNMEKSEVRRILDAFGFSLQELPFHYLGVPICAKKISKNECSTLVEKMTARIRTWSSRNLSFAARSVLINSVLLAIHAYWSQVMILPQKIVNDIEAICRNFLWKGHAIAAGPGLIAWDSLCHPKANGGLGFKRVHEWNKAAMGKYIWAISNKEDSLWLKWIHCFYIQNEDWWQYQPPTQGSWYWRRLVTLKNQFKELAGDKVNYDVNKFGNLNTPKHSFISWIVVQDRLKTRDRLKRMGIVNEDTCTLCGQVTETCAHLFFDCPVAKSCLHAHENIGYNGISSLQ